MARDYQREVDQGIEGVAYNLDHFGVLDEGSYPFPENDSCCHVYCENFDGVFLTILSRLVGRFLLCT